MPIHLATPPSMNVGQCLVYFNITMDSSAVPTRYFGVLKVKWNSLYFLISGKVIWKEMCVSLCKVKPYQR